MCSGDYCSYKHFTEYLNHFKGRVNHVLVKNWGLCDEWESLESNKFIQQKIREYGVKVLDFPEFKGKDCLNTIDEQGLTFGAAKESENLAKINRQRIKSFSKKVYQAFDDAGVFYKDVKVQKVGLTSPEIDEVKLSERTKASEPIKKQNKVKIAASNGRVEPEPELEQLSELV